MSRRDGWDEHLVCFYGLALIEFWCF